MVKIKIDNKDILDSLFTNVLTTKELADAIRQVYRALEKLEPDTEKQAHTLHQLLCVADDVESWYEPRHKE